MCGRYTITSDPALIRRTFRLRTIPNLQPRYNVAPTQSVPIVSLGPGERRLIHMRWGMVPRWATDLKFSTLINARAETIATNATFRAAFHKRRCLIVADSYYEWASTASGKQPWRIMLRSEEPFAFAGIWETWRSNGTASNLVDAAAIITTEANEGQASIHDRMPVILADLAEHDAWLDPYAPQDRLTALLRPLPAANLCAYPVSRFVNSMKNDRPECAAPLSENAPALV